MYATVRRYNIENEDIQDILRRVKSEVVPILENHRGFEAYYAFKSGNGICSVTIFETRPAAEDANRMVIERVKKNYASISAPDVTSGELTVSAMAHHHA